ncbi:MAG: hypothetical protein QOG36_1485, partial [Actinomycetota bacterium]|nr:hypothetical protein [Actinomycetota bacterium]
MARHQVCDEAMAAKRKLAGCDARLGEYRSALEAGAHPSAVASWMTKVRGERLAAEEALKRATPPATLSAAE